MSKAVQSSCTGPAQLRTAAGAQRYVYIKNGDAVEQVERVLGGGAAPLSSGPDAFLWDFFQSAAGSQVLVLSRQWRSCRAGFGAVQAEVLNKGCGVVQRSLRGPAVFVGVLLRVLRMRPTRILCGSSGAVLWAAFLAARWMSVPLVHSRHNQLGGDERWYRRAATALDAWCIRHTDAVICHGPYLRDQLQQIRVPSDRLFEFDVGFGDMLTEARHPLDSAYQQVVEGRTVVLFAGRLEEDKGIFDLLDACAERLARDPNVRLVYAGTGTQLEQLTAEVARRGLNDRVALLGMVPHRQLAPLMLRCRLLVTPTRGVFPEGRCMAAMEGVVMGLPVIAPDWGPFPYIVRDGVNGLLYRAESVAELGRCILQVLDDPELQRRLAEGARRIGEELRVPPLRFGAAVEQAFSLAETGESWFMRKETHR